MSSALSYIDVAKDLSLKYCMPVQRKSGTLSVAKQTAATASTPGPYERMGMRVQKIINSPTAQKSRAALLFRQPDESEDDWAQLL
ncbi:hypothetical protein ALP91_04465, partial [Pseudomonas savastanoi pv. glycinea]